MSRGLLWSDQFKKFRIKYASKPKPRVKSREQTNHIYYLDETLPRLTTIVERHLRTKRLKFEERPVEKAVSPERRRLQTNKLFES